MFSLGSTLVILFYSCHLLILLPSLEKWPSATSFLIRYVCSLVFRSGSFLRMARDWHLPKKLQRCSMAWIQWFLALRLQAPEFSILSVARRTYFFLTQNYQLMISGYEASRARLLYSEQGSQDIFSLYEIYLNWWWVLILRLQGPNFPTSSVALRTYIFFIQGVSKFIISDSEASRTRSLYSERGSQDVQFPCTKLI